MRRSRLPLGIVSTLLFLTCGHWAAHYTSGQEYPDMIRIGAVNTPFYTGLLDALVEDFKKQGGLDLWIYSGKDVYDQARSGKVDMVISHYGKDGIEPFVLEGRGEWPRPVFANQAALIGPDSDPAGIRGMDSTVEAFRRIAESGAPYVVNNSPGFCYFTEILWRAAEKPKKVHRGIRPHGRVAPKPGEGPAAVAAMERVGGVATEPAVTAESHPPAQGEITFQVR